MSDPPLAFARRIDKPPALEIRVNFGVFAGRVATPAEIDELGKLLVPETGRVSIVSEERHEIGANVEALLHQVRIEIPADQLPDDDAGVDALAEELTERADEWARSCIADRQAGVAEL